MTPAWIVVAVLIVATATIKAAGPLTLGRAQLPTRMVDVSSMLAPALLGGLLVYETVGAASGPGITLDARLVGLTVAAAALTLRLPILLVVVLGATATTLSRLLVM